MLGDDAFAVGCSASMFRDGQYLEVIKVHATAVNSCQQLFDCQVRARARVRARNPVIARKN